MSKMPSFKKYAQDVFSTTDFFDTIKDRSKKGLINKSVRELYELYTSFQKNTEVVPLEYRNGAQPQDFAIGITKMIRSGKNVLPYTEKLFEKYGTEQITNKSQTTSIENHVNDKNIHDYIWNVARGIDYTSNREITEIMRLIMAKEPKEQKRMCEFLRPKTLGQEIRGIERRIGVLRNKIPMPKEYCKYM